MSDLFLVFYSFTLVSLYNFWPCRAREIDKVSPQSKTNNIEMNRFNGIIGSEIYLLISTKETLELLSNGY